MNRILAALILLLPCAAGADPVGYRELDLPATATQRALHVTLWYPAQPTATTTIGGNAVFVGFEAAPGAAPDAGKHRLVLLSHGYGGWDTHMSQLGEVLASHGYVVAAIDHVDQPVHEDFLPLEPLI